jgi:hypothetical protein
LRNKRPMADSARYSQLKIFSIGLTGSWAGISGGVAQAVSGCQIGQSGLLIRA